MKVAVSQVYIEVGVYYPFSYRFQVYISDELSKLVSPSAAYVERYGADYDLIINMSAKSGLTSAEVKGPTVFRKTKDVEYTVFLPFDRQERCDRASFRRALRELLGQITLILVRLEVDVSQLIRRSEAIVDRIVDDERMFEDRDV